MFEYAHDEATRAQLAFSASSRGLPPDIPFGGQFAQIGSAVTTPTVFSPVTTGRRRGRARKVGNMGDRHPSMEHHSSSDITPDSPLITEFTGNGRKRRGGFCLIMEFKIFVTLGGTPTQRGPRKSRAKLQNICTESYPYPFQFPGTPVPDLLQPSTSNLTNFIARNLCILHELFHVFTN